MTQLIESKISIEIPSNLILIEKAKILELENQTLIGQTWNATDVTNRLGGKDIRDWKLVFYKYREEVDIRNGGFVKFPTSKGMPWKFHAKMTAHFIDIHWKEFMETKDRF